MNIARVAHAVNAAYCESQGDASQVAWDDAPEWQRNSAIAGVEMHLANPDATPEQSHESWLAQKVAEGWVYGEVKDAEAKQHPCCVPYADLPAAQKAKDYIFRAVVHELKDVPDDAEHDDPRITALQDELNTLRDKYDQALRSVSALNGIAVIGGIAVKYIGPRETWVDRLYGSGLSFGAGQIRDVPGELARRLLKHSDLFEQAAAEDAAESAGQDDTADLLAKRQQEQQEHEERERDLADLHREVDALDKAGLIDIGARYGVKLAKNATEAKVSEARAAIHQHIDQFGAV